MARHSKKSQEPTLTTKEKLSSIKKAKKQKLQEKRGRLVVRNLPFETTEENLREYFEKFGEISEIKVLKKEGGKLVGCAFVQYALVQKAKKARHHTNGKPFLGRDITVDFALAKDKYEEVKVKEENGVDVKDEPIKEDEIKSEDDEDEEMDNGDVEKEEEDSDVENGDDSESSMDEAENGEEEEEEDEEDGEMEESGKQKRKKPEFLGDDMSDGKTVFVRNLPFSATNDQLKECMSQFGPLCYGVICVDKFTEHSKGTAFVKYQNKEDADKAQAAGTELTLLGNVLNCQRALSREELRQKYQGNQADTNAPKGGRNLYLAKEGVILAGSPAAQGVSSNDMMRRLRVENYKSQKLKNLDNFVSPVRLVIHNLPMHMKDFQLKNLFRRYGPKSAFVKSAKVMRDFRYVDARGVGRSKEFGYVTYATHEGALAALRAINNNPHIFKPYKRPIVTFAVESRSAMNLKQRRLENSRLRNPYSKNYDPEAAKKRKVEGEEEEEEKEPSFVGQIAEPDESPKKKPALKKQGEKKVEEEEEEEEEEESFVGVTAEPEMPVKMRSKFALKNQAEQHVENVKKEKKKLRKSLEKKQKESIKQPKQKVVEKESTDNLSKIEKKHKKELAEAQVQGNKWYDE